MKPEGKKNLAAANRKMWKDPEHRIKHKAAHNRPEVKLKHSAVMKMVHGKHENKVRSILSAQLQWHEKKLEREGLL